MIQDENVQCWINCWNSTADTINFLSDDIQAERWNKRADSFGKNLEEKRKKQKDADFFKLLDEVGFNPEGATVLDIGCGPGSLTLPLARAGAKVTSLDISSKMLERLKETAENEDLSISPIECSWWTADIDTMKFRNKFDLVIASFTPGIRDVETFDRMISCSKKYCYYSNFIRRDPVKIPPDIYIRILQKVPEQEFFAAGFFYPFMYLYTLGFQPIVKINHKTEDQNQSWEEAANSTIGYLEMKHEISDENRNKIMEYYKNCSENGIYTTHSETYKGMMAWALDNRKKIGK
ncbi:MAG: class I SAM-dependent methyltransferase [Methanomicrobiales archaeon]|nr:class I SAM-dependent methyltransferase [Methanomicrobiales archaeon]